MAPYPPRPDLRLGDRSGLRSRPYVFRAEGTCLRYAVIEGCAGLAGAEPQAQETGAWELPHSSGWTSTRGRRWRLPEGQWGGEVRFFGEITLMAAEVGAAYLTL